MRLLILPVEVKNRDLDSRLLLALEAISKGYEVIIGNQRFITLYLKQIKGGIYFDKSIAANKHSFFKKIKKNGIRIVATDEEGLAAINNEWTYLKARISDGTLKLVDRYYPWSEAETRLIEQHFPEHKNKVIKTGNPRVDLQVRFNKKIYNPSEEALKIKFGKIILCPSSFLVNHIGGDGFLDAIYEKYKITESLNEYKLFESENEYQLKSFKKYVSLVLKLASNFKDYTFVIRPHPSEDSKYWANKFKDFGNVVVTKKFNINDWLSVANVVIHSSCTTGLESALGGVKTIAYLPYRDHKYASHISNDFSIVCKNEDEVITTISNIENVFNPVVDNILYNANPSEDPAYKAIVDDLLSLNDREIKRIPQPSLHTYLLIFYSMLRGFFKNRRYHLAKFDKLDEKEISKKIAVLSRVAFDEMPITINSLIKDVYHIK